MFKETKNKFTMNNIIVLILVFFICQLLVGIGIFVVKNNNMKNKQIKTLEKYKESYKKIQNLDERLKKIEYYFVETKEEENVEYKDYMPAEEPEIKEKMTPKLLQRFQNAVFQENLIAEAAVVSEKDEKYILKVSTNGRNKNNKEYIKNLLQKMKLDYNLKDYSIVILWKDGMKDVI